MSFTEFNPTTDEIQLLVERYRAEVKTLKQERDDALVALRDTQRQLSETQTRSGIGTWERLMDSDEIIWSDETYRIHGLDPENFSPSVRNIMDLVLEEDRARVQRLIRKEVAEKVGLSIMYRIRRPDGAIRILHTKAVVERGETGQTIRRYGTTRDVTDGKSVEASALDIGGDEQAPTKSPLYIVFCDLNGTITYQNQAFYDLAKNIKIGDSIFSFEPYFSKQILGPVLERVRDRLLFEKFEFGFNTEDGESISHNALIEPIIFEDELEGFSFYILRQVERFEIRQIQLESDRSLSEALRMANIGHWERDLSEETSSYSDQALHVLGVDRETFVPSTENFMQIIHPEDLQEVGARVRALYEKGVPFELEFRVITSEGDVRYVLGQGERYGDKDTGLKAIGTVMDITDQRMMLDSIRQSELRFSTLFEETKHAHEQLLAMSRRLSTIQEEERRRIALDLHDEAGGLLAAIQLALQLVDLGFAKQNENVRRAVRFVDELIEIIHRFSHELRPASLDQLGLRSTLLAHFREYQDRHGIALDIEVELENEDQIRKDAQIATFRIVQEALNNVARHAFVESAAVSVKRNNGVLEISVMDKGVGAVTFDLSPSDRMGLDGMRERAVLLGGSLDLDSVPGEGTMMRAQLPV